MAALAFLAFVACGIPFALAQTNTTLPDTTIPATCVAGQQAWVYNSLSESPCDIASKLVQVCTGEPYIFWALPRGWNYNGPSLAHQSPCLCSTVVYSMTAACSVCQGRNFISWGNYTKNCSPTNIFVGSFPYPLPTDVKVPGYAYLNITYQGSFDLAAAAIATIAESSYIAKPTSKGAPPNITGSAPKSKSSDIGVIIGGVVAGVMVLGIAVYAILLIRKREASRAKPKPSPDPQTPWSGEKAESWIPLMQPPAGPMRYYDPSDPSTFPTNYNPNFPTSPTSYQDTASVGTYSYVSASPTGPAQSPGQYRGVAEIS